MWYDELPARANQAIALGALRRWSRATRVNTPSIRAFEDHLWAYMALDISSFTDWYKCEPAALSAALNPNAALPVDIADACVRATIPAAEARRVLHLVADVTYSYLFGAVDTDLIVEDLMQLGEILASYGDYLPEADEFAELAGGPTDVGKPEKRLIESWRARSVEPLDNGGPVGK